MLEKRLQVEKIRRKVYQKMNIPSRFTEVKNQEFQLDSPVEKRIYFSGDDNHLHDDTRREKMKRRRGVDHLNQTHHEGRKRAALLWLKIRRGRIMFQDGWRERRRII